MAITLQSVVTNLNTYLGDASEDRITNIERFQFINEATVWLNEELGNEHMVSTQSLEYVAGVSTYKLTSSLSDLLVGGDLRKSEDSHKHTFTRRSPKEIAEDIGKNSTELSWAVERRDGDIYVIINNQPKYTPKILATFDTSTSDGGTWTAFTSASDATNITFDTNEYTEGSGCLNFDITVAQSANNLATVYINKTSGVDLSNLEDLGSFVFDVYIPNITYVSSVSIRVSSDSSVTPATVSNYLLATASTDINGNTLVNGWNKIKIDWSDMTVVGTPSYSSMKYFQFSINYTASKTDDTNFRLDNFYIVRQEVLTFHYISWFVGTSTGGTDITAYTALTDIPFYSGRYDQYRYPVAHMATALAFYSLRLRDDAEKEEIKASQALERYRKIFESQKTRPEKRFKPGQINLRGTRRRRFNSR